MTPLIAEILRRSDGYTTEIRPQGVFEALSLLEVVAANEDAHNELGWSGDDVFKEIVITILNRVCFGSNQRLSTNRVGFDY
ncbi:hypothetical protein [Halobaculum marinum]|uniref:Uncharacterized protein n=1 Tax=Halobaculum marinum TaxID=3031996 RepID=A0ABD5X443_9EURY|nr:hypothetical protein [Halobaculum sp. DT55]